MTRRTTTDLRIAFMADFHAEEVADLDNALRMVDAALELEPEIDHIIVGGDITDRSQQNLHVRFANGLKRRKCQGLVSVVPGNHDIFPASKRAIGASILDIVTGRNPTARYEIFGELFGGGRRKGSGTRLIRGESYPFARVLSEHVVLVALDSTRNGRYDPREWAAGEITREAIDAATEFFDEHEDARHKLIALHHAPWIRYESAEDDTFPMGMAEPTAPTAIRWIEKSGATLVLCGHWHNRSGIELKKRLGEHLCGFCAGISGGVDNDEGDNRRSFHVIDLLSNGDYRVSEKVFVPSDVTGRLLPLPRS